MCKLKNIHLSCDERLQDELIDLAHVVRDLVERVAVTQDKQSPAFNPDVIRSLQTAYGALMRAAFSVYLFKDMCECQDDSPA